MWITRSSSRINLWRPIRLQNIALHAGPTYICTSLSFLQVGSLVATATDILIKALQIKLAYVNDILARLSPLVSDNPRQTTPAELSFSHYEEWLESNQQLFEFNSELYELERVKFEMKQKQERVKQTRDGESDADTVGEVYYDRGNKFNDDKNEDTSLFLSSKQFLCALYLPAEK